MKNLKLQATQFKEAVIRRGVASEVAMLNRNEWKADSLGFFARVASGILFSALDTALTQIKEPAIREFSLWVCDVAHAITNLLTDSEKNNKQQIEQYFADNAKNIGSVAFSAVSAILGRFLPENEAKNKILELLDGIKLD